MILREMTSLTQNQVNDGIIKGVKLLGWKSKNNRTYLKEAVEEAINLYEGVPIYIDHHVNKAPSYKDRVGIVKSPYIQEDGVYGDAVLNVKHSLFEQLKFDIENNSKNIGFSHMAEGDANAKGEIFKLHKIRSVDIVSEPATTQNFFEQEEKTNDEIKVLTERIQKLEEDNAKLMEEVRGLKSKQEINEQWVPVQDERPVKLDFLERYFASADKYKYMKGNSR